MSFPHDPLPDSSLTLLRLGAEFGRSRYGQLGSDAFRLRLGLMPAIMAMGREAHDVFYVPDRFTRRGALPPTTLRSLQDVGSVMTLDGQAHRHRKAMLMAVLNNAAPRMAADAVEAAWHDTVPRWRKRGIIALLPGVRALLTRGLCQWAGVPLDAAEGPQRTAEFGAMIDGAGAVGPRNWWGLFLRQRTERWARERIARQRAHPQAPAGSAVAVIAAHRDDRGELLPLEIAGVELINCIRPAVACERYVVFAADALNRWPEWRERIDPHDDAAVARFAQEVRRFYPFLPAIGGKALEPFEWRGERFGKGAWMLFDLHGTNHDPRLFEAPDRFDPDRYLREPSAVKRIVANGGGEPFTTHRCPGEAMTVELIKRGTKLLLTTPYKVRGSDHGIDPGRLPPLPADRFRVRFL